MRRVYCLLIVFATALALFFHQGRSWNVDSRLLTVYAIVEHGSLRADAWKGETGDYATINGHTYSDKAPLSSFLVAPFYWGWRVHEHFRPQSYRDHEAANHLAIVVASAIPFALFAALVFARVRRRARTPRAAVWIALMAVCGTCLLNYGGFFLGHMMAAMLFIAAYRLAVDRERSFLFAGFLGSCAVLTEYTLVLTQVIVCAYLLLGPDRWRRFGLYVGGAVPGAIGMFVYNRIVTGKFTDFPYSHVPDSWAPMQTAFGLRLPDPSAAWELLFGQYRGLAFYAPTLLLFLPLIALRFDGPRRRRNLVLFLSTAYVVLISSYFKWDGGWCTGPRHLAPIIALGTYEGAGALAAIRRGRVMFTLLAVWGALVAVCASATDCIPPETWKAPAFEVFFPRVLHGDLNDHVLLFEWGLRRASYMVGLWFVLFVVFAAVLSVAYRRLGIPKTSAIVRATSAPTG
jgi:hypothetical protein